MDSSTSIDFSYSKYGERVAHCSRAMSNEPSDNDSAHVLFDPCDKGSKSSSVNMR